VRAFREYALRHAECHPALGADDAATEIARLADTLTQIIRFVTTSSLIPADHGASPISTAAPNRRFSAN